MSYAEIRAVRCQPDVYHIKRVLQTAELILGSVEKILERNYAVKDPVIRYVNLVDKLNMITDVFSTFIELWFKNDDRADYIMTHKGEDYDEAVEKELSDMQREKEQLLAKIKILGKNFRDEMSRLIDWIQNPKYSPDHPLGEMMLQATMGNFKRGVQTEINNKEKDDSEHND